MHTLYKKGQPFRWARLLSLLLLLLPLMGRAQSSAVSTTVVISQIYGGGGNASATYTNDFIELHNISGTAQTLTGYSVQYAPAATVTGNFTGVTVLPTITIPAGGYYLIQEQGGTTGVALPTPDLTANSTTGSFNMSATAGRVALVNSTTAQPAACGTNTAFVDYVGFGSTAACAEGTKVTTTSSGNAFSFIRLAATGTTNTGCKETNDNSADFTTASPPTPRNSASAAVACVTVSNPVPTITSLAPGSATAGDPAQTLTVNGTNFISSSVVNFNGTARTTTYVSATQLTIQLTTADLATAGSYDVTVTNPTPGGGTTTASTFTVNPAPASNPVPTITSLSPSSVTAGAAAQTLTVNGTNFIATSVVNFNGTARTTTYVSATQLTIQLTTADQATAGSYDVTVTNPAPGGGTSAASSFTVNALPNPEINVQVAGVDYLTGSTYDFGTTTFGTPVGPVTFTVQNTSTTDVLTVSGTGITSSSGAGFTLSAPSSPFTVAPGSTATFTVTFSPTSAGAKTGVVTITNNDQNEASYVINLTGQANTPPPTATNYSATSILAGIQSTEIITGTNLSGATVTITGNTAGTVTAGTVAASSTQDTFTLLATQAGSFTLNVTTPGGTLTQVVTVTTPPAGFFEPFESATKTTYTTAPGTNVTLTTGSWNFTEALLGAQAPTATPGSGEKKNNGQAVRFRTQGSVSMNFDKANGAGDITFLAALYGTDAAQTSPASAVLVEISTDAGATYTTVGSITPTATLASYTLTANKTGSVRLRFSSNTTGTTPRINLDDVQISDYVVAVCDAPTGLTPGSITSSSATVSFTASASAANGYTVTTTPATTTQQLAAGATSVSFSGLTPNTAYSVSIVSKCSATSTSSAATANFTTLALAPTLAVSQGGTSYPSGGTAYNFGNQTVNTTSSAVSFTLTNSGPDALTISSIATTGDYAVSGATPTTVAANGGTATVSVTFTPTATGTRTGTLVINSDATNGATYTVNLTGNGQPVPAASLAVSQSGTSYPSGGAAYSFGNQTVSTTSSPVAFTLTNSGNSALTISSATTTGDFAVSGATPTTVAANGGTATINVTFTPSTTGARTGTLVINSNAANGTTYTVNLAGNGQAATLPDLTVTTGTPTSPTPISGNYNNVTIAPGGNAVLVGPLTVAGTLTIQAGGGLAQGGASLGCQLLTGSGNFNLQAGGTLAICDPLGISPTGVPTGAVLLTGTRTYSPLAQYIYSGSSAQVTGLGLPSTILALGVQNAAGVTLSQPLSLTQGVNLNLGNLITNGQTFTLLSSNAGTAGVVNTGGVVVGTATVQRSINSSNAIGYRHYSAPVSNTTFADLATTGFSPVFNSGYNSDANPGGVIPFPTVFGYDQNRIATTTNNLNAFDKGWFSPAGPGDPMVVGKGYTVNAPNTALVDFVGTLNNGPVPSGTLSRGSDAAAGWHLLGNPYPSPLDWSLVTPAQRPGMDAAIYIFESAGQYGGSYRASVNGVGGNSNSGNAQVVSGQGYFVRVSTPNGTGQVNLDNSNRVTNFGAQPSFGRGTADSRPQVALTLQGASVSDAAYVYFQAGATAGKDVEFDATKLANPHGLNLTSVAGGEELAINGLPALGTATVLVPLNVAAPQAGSYSFTAGSLANLAGTTVTLVDALTSTRTVLSTGTTYAISLSSTTATGRFSLEFRPSGALATTAAKALAAQTQLFPNPASGSFRVQLPVLAAKTAVQATLLNALGQTVLSRSLSATAGQALDTEFDVRALAAGVYTLRLDVAGTLVARKVVIE